MAYTFDTCGPSDHQLYYRPEVKREPTAGMFGLLDMLATVATQSLNTVESLKNVITRPLSPKAADVKQELPASKVTSTRNPRRLTDYNVFGFQQVTF